MVLPWDDSLNPEVDNYDPVVGPQLPLAPASITSVMGTTCLKIPRGPRLPTHDPIENVSLLGEVTLCPGEAAKVHKEFPVPTEICLSNRVFVVFVYVQQYIPKCWYSWLQS